MRGTLEERLTQFEARLLSVERSQTLDVPFAEFFELLLQAIRAVADEPDCTVWLFTQGNAERIAYTGAEAVPPEPPVAGSSEWLDGKVSTRQELTSDERRFWCYRAFEEVSKAFTVCMEVRSATDPLQDFPVTEAIRPLAECLAAWFRRSLIARLEDKLSTQVQVSDFCHKLYPHLHGAEFEMKAASELRLLLRVDRVSLVKLKGDSCELAGISGSNHFDKSLEIPAALAKMAEEIFSSEADASGWIQLKDFARSGLALPEDIRSIISEGGTTQVRGFRVTSSALSDSASSDVKWGVLAELIGETAPPSEAHVMTCQGQIPKVLSNRPLVVGHQGLRQWLRKGLLIPGLLVTLIILGSIPRNFEIAATGEMVPLKQQRIFAPGSGLIQELSVGNGSTVQAGQILLRIHNPELALKTQEVLGLLETERVRLLSVQRARLSADRGVAQDTLEHAVGGEQAVRQRISDLESRLQLLRTQADRLAITAAYSGHVFRRNLELDLHSRPVQQGDFLFELIADDSAWRLELSVDEHESQYVSPLIDIDNGLPLAGNVRDHTNIRFRFAAEPDANHTATFTGFQPGLVHENGRSRNIAFATISTESLPATKKHQQPGTTVSARISCGHRPAAFVLFREFVEFVQEKLFAWSLK